MEKKGIFAQIEAMEEQMGAMYADLTGLKATVVQLLEENQRLQIENQQLRRLIRQETNPELVGGPIPELDDAEQEDVNRLISTGPGEGYDNLNRLYQEGFHICNVYYGHLRTEGDCLFCLNFLNK